MSNSSEWLLSLREMGVGRPDCNNDEPDSSAWKSAGVSVYAWRFGSCRKSKLGSEILGTS